MTAFSTPDITPHGPRITEIGINTPKMMIVLWVFAGLCWLISLLIYLDHRSKLLKIPYTRMRENFLTIILFPLVLSSFGFACLLSVRPAFVWELAQHIYEAVTIAAFLNVLLSLLGHDVHLIVQKLKKGSPAKIWAAPPLLCFFHPFVRESYVTAATLKFVYFCVDQFVYIIPTGGFFRLWMFIDGFSASMIPGYIGTISMIIAMQGLFMIYRASKATIQDYHPTIKFATIKLIVFIGAVQRLIVNAIIKPHDVLGDYDQNALVSVWGAFLTCIESPFFALAMTYAFPAEELRLYISQGLHKIEEDDAEVDPRPKDARLPGRIVDVDLGGNEIGNESQEKF